jgi:hypothetical protein
MKFRNKNKFRYGSSAYTGPFRALLGTIFSIRVEQEIQRVGPKKDHPLHIIGIESTNTMTLGHSGSHGGYCGNGCLLGCCACSLEVRAIVLTMQQ